jgi:hypothetical protein
MGCRRCDPLLLPLLLLAACGSIEPSGGAPPSPPHYAAHGRNGWLDATNQKLPDFAQAFAWARAVADRTGRPLVWWQIPVGNSGLPDHDGAWRDNRVEYFFAHPDQVAGSGAVAIAFGAGAGDQTTPESDGGYLAACAVALDAAGGQPLCP